MDWFGPPEYFEVKNDRIRLSTDGEDDITDKMRAAMGKGSIIVLDGCQTARGKANIASEMSRVLPGVTVTGGIGIFQLGVPLKRFAFGKKGYYINGELVLSSW